jgi:hypothetical protein
LAPHPDSAQDRGMAWRRSAEQAHRAIDGASSHITFWPFVWEVARGLYAATGAFIGYLLVKATPALNQYAPTSYVLAAIVAVLLLLGLLHLAITLMRRIRTPAPHDVAAHTQTGLQGFFAEANPHLLPPAPVDPHDVIDAKNRLANFVSQTLSPAIDYANATLLSAADMIRAVDLASPQAIFAWNGVHAAGVPPGTLGVFDSSNNVRVSTLPQLEHAVSLAISKYTGTMSQITEVISQTSANSSQWEAGGFRVQCIKLAKIHRDLEVSFMAIANDIHYDSLRGMAKRVDSFLPKDKQNWLDYIEGFDW